jgi:phosphatidylserine/phosphatidylglycerophosphate/cardiolipin synthase-like enzyme
MVRLIFIIAFFVGGFVLYGGSFIRLRWRRDSGHNETAADFTNSGIESAGKEMSFIEQRRVKVIQELIAEASRPAADSHQDLRVCRLMTHSDHRECLLNAFGTAQRRIIIVSPQISVWAIQGSGIDALVHDAIFRGINVVVFTDDQLNREQEGAPRRSAVLGKKLMEKAGAAVFIANGIHQKTLIIDNQSIADGSYNWLSAVRNKNHVHHREERTNLITGGEASTHIRKELERLVRLAPPFRKLKSA